MRGVIFFILFLFSAGAEELTRISDGKSIFRRHFSKAFYSVNLEIDDPISKNPMNVRITKVFNQQRKLLGYVRKVVTTTGCNSACLPLIFSISVDKSKKYHKLTSNVGLTKLGHAKFTFEDYLKLDIILKRDPPNFKMVKHPKEMVDALTGATMPLYQGDVVKSAAYSSLRINKYVQHTISFLMKNLSIKIPDDTKKMIEDNLRKANIESISVSDLKRGIDRGDVIVLDAREREEFDISHIPGAVYIGFKNFEKSIIDKYKKTKKSVVTYCSVGYRSSLIAKQFKEKGVDVRDLEGGIFEWLTQGNELIDGKGKPTGEIHTYNKKWGDILKTGEKVY